MRTRFLAGNTQQERAEESIKHSYCFSKSNDMVLMPMLVIITQYFNLPYIDLRLLNPFHMEKKSFMSVFIHELFGLIVSCLILVFFYFSNQPSKQFGQRI
jgi:hypothetical protein